MHAGVFILRLVVLAVLFLPFRQAQAASLSPQTTAATIRESLFNAQMLMAASPSKAEKEYASAKEAYSGLFAQTLQTEALSAHQRIVSGFSQAGDALAVGEAAGFAAARAQIWTAILSGSYLIEEQAIQQNDPATAREWLPVREYRTTTRFSRPSTSATLAVDGLARQSMSSADALLAIRADLLDTYQANLTLALHDLPVARGQGFSVRTAELAALAEGYFLILSPAYGLARGESELTGAWQAFQQLRIAAISNNDLTTPLRKVEEALQHFRAAPLTEAEKSRRAGQMLRYLSLVPVEYQRGVHAGQVINDIEVQEAISFTDGAYAAFSDLENLLDELDPAVTLQARQQFETLSLQLDQSIKKEDVATDTVIENQTAALSELLKTAMPPEWTRGSSAGDFDVINTLLDQMETAVIGKDYAAAESARLEAYAIMEVGPEARLIAFAPQLKVELEDLFWNGQGSSKGLAYLIKNQAAHRDIQNSRARLDAALGEAQTILQASSAPAAVAVNAGMIMFREGLEAVIILASLMSSMKRPEEKKYRHPMWLGTILALAATILTWVLAHDVLQSLAQYGEKLEAVVSMIAIAVLLVIMNWFFHKVYWTEWLAGFHTRKRQIISGETGLWLGFVTLGFTSVYREGFESVIFMQALVLESGIKVVLMGVGAALAAVCLVGFITFRLQVNLPYKKMLIVTGILIGTVLIQMVGNTVHAFQVVGWLPIHVIGEQPLPYWLGSWFGIYATWEGLTFQIVAALFIIGSYFLAEGLKQNIKSRKVETSKI